MHGVISQALIAGLMILIREIQIFCLLPVHAGLVIPTVTVRLMRSILILQLSIVVEELAIEMEDALRKKISHPFTRASDLIFC
jgi:hypothetical protein